MRSVTLRGPAIHRIRLYRVARFGPPPVPVRRAWPRWRAAAVSMAVTVLVGGLL